MATWVAWRALSKISPTKNDRYCMISLPCGRETTKIAEIQNRLVVARGGELEAWVKTVKGLRGTIGSYKTVTRRFSAA